MRLRGGDFPDVTYWNGLFLPIAQKLAGRLNEHDISSGQFAYSNLASSCYYTGHHNVAAVDPGLTANNWFTQGGAAGDAVHVFTDSPAWERVTTLIASLTTGEDVLWCISLCQHASWLGGSTTAAPSISTPMRLQYALSIDGTIVDETITGSFLPVDGPAQELYKVTEDDAVGSTDFDWRHIQYIQHPIGINQAAHPVRLMATIPVGPGSHQVETKCRRLQRTDGSPDENGLGTTTQVFNRRLAAIRIKGTSQHTGSTSSLDVAAWEDGDTITASRINSRLTALRDKINDLGDGDLSRGALNRFHLPTTILYPEVIPLNGVPVNVTSVYAGYGAAGGWTTINDGGGNNARTATAMNLTAESGVLVVLANVQVVSVIDGVTAENIQALGILALRLMNSAGTATVIANTEVYVNAHNPDPTATTAMRAIEDDIPLMWVVDVATLSAANRNITYIEVVGATWDGSGAANAVTMRTYRVMLTKWFFRGATLS